MPFSCFHRISVSLALTLLPTLSLAGLRDDLPSTEYASLVALYNATNGEGWENNTGWLDPAAESWHGVTTEPTASGRTVVGIFLRDNSLGGAVPPEIGNFPSLRDLDLSFNIFSGPIPPEIGKLTALTDLSFQRCFQPGAFPPELGNLRSLQKLNLGQNRLTGMVPPAIWNLSSLQSLNLESNLLSGSLPPEIQNLTSIENLSLDENEFSGPIPPEIGNLSTVRILSLSGNSLNGVIPPQIGNLSSVTDLILDRNLLTGSIPQEIFNLTTLDQLDLSFNGLTGEISSSIANLTLLEQLNLGINLLAGNIPPELGNLPRLFDLDFARNQLTGTIPPELANSPLRRFNVSLNRLTGTIPSEFANLTGLESFNISVNPIEGILPAGFASLPALKFFGARDTAIDFSDGTASASTLATLKTNGTFVRTIPGGSYETWLPLFFSGDDLLDPKTTGADADPDHDGVTNILEYALLTDPSVPSGPALPAPTLFIEDSKVLGATVVYSADGTLVDVILIPERSDNLQNWEIPFLFSDAENFMPVSEITAITEGEGPAYFRMRARYLPRDQPWRTE